MWAHRLSLLTTITLVPLTATAQFKQEEFLENEGKEIERPAPFITTEQLDPLGLHKFHLTNRFSFSNGDETFSDDAFWSVEAKASLNVSKGIAVTAALLIGLEDVNLSPNNAFFGNFRLGFYGGGQIHFQKSSTEWGSPSLLLGGGLDIYVPTAPEFEQNACGERPACDPVGAVRAIRSYEPQLYLPRVLSFRARFNVGFRYKILAASVELALTPGVSIRDEADFLMFFGFSGQIAVRALSFLEPYLEVGTTVLTTGDIQTPTDPTGADFSAPVLLGIGLRTHFLGLAPALFVTIDLENTGLIFGIDLAAAFRTSLSEKRNDDLRDRDEFYF